MTHFFKSFAWLLVFMTALLLHADPESFEGAKAEGWNGGTGGKVTVSDLRAKVGNQSLRWNWTRAKAPLRYKFPTFKVKKGTAFGAWIHNPTSMDARLQLVFSSQGKEVKRVWYNLNFTGWHVIGAPYVNLGVREGASIDQIEFIAPDRVAKGELFFDWLDPEAKGSPANDFIQPWIGKPEILNEPFEKTIFSETDIALNRPYLPKLIPANKFTVDTKKTLEKIHARAGNSFAFASTVGYGSMEQLTQDFEALGITETNGIVKGLPIEFGNKGFFMALPGALNFKPKVMPVFRKLQSAYLKESGKDKNKAAAMFVMLSKHWLDQGFQEGNNNYGWIGNGYDWRNFPSTVYRMREPLEKAGILEPMLRSMMWFNCGRDALAEYPSSSPDLILNYSSHLIQAAVLLPDAAERYQRLHAIKSYYEKIVTKNGPFWNDGSIHHHGGHHIAYGSYGIPPLVQTQLMTFNGTGLAISEAARGKLDKVLWANHMQAVNGQMAPNLLMRSGTPGGLNVSAIARPLAKISDSKDVPDAYAASILLALEPNSNDAECKKYRAMKIEPRPPTGHLTLNTAATAMHRRDNWQVAIAGLTEPFRCLEIYGWMENNNYDITSRNGSVIVTSNGTHGFSEAGWNHNFWPGTTTMVTPPHQLFEGYTMFNGPGSKISGGTDLDLDGIWGIDFRLRDVHFKKSVFCFGGTVTVVTSDITKRSKRGGEVVTTIVQEKTNPSASITVNGKAVTDVDFHTTLPGDKPATFRDGRGNGYYVHPGNAVEVNRGSQQWPYLFKRYLLDKGNDPCIDIKGKRFKTSLSDAEQYYRPSEGIFNRVHFTHGDNPQGEGCVYSILPECNDQQLSEFADAMKSAKPPHLLIQSDATAHILYDRPSKTVGFIIFDANGKLSAKSLIRSISHPGFVMLRDDGANWTLSFASSDPKLTEPVSISIVGRAKPVILTPNYPCSVVLSVTKK